MKLVRKRFYKQVPVWSIYAELKKLARDFELQGYEVHWWPYSFYLRLEDGIVEFAPCEDGIEEYVWKEE